MSERVFLLSPANCRGRRAQQVMSPRATFDLAVRLRSAAGVPLGEVFSHMSGLYFRGKFTYAQRFGRALVITPDSGLLPADIPASLEILRRFSEGDISLENRAYRDPLEATARALASEAASDAEFVLLGSVASEKYVGVLGEVLGPRLRFPAEFVGRGDMSRGGLLLRAVAEGVELEYIPLAGAARRGKRPPKLTPR